MAKGFFNQILSLAGLKLPDPNKDHDNPSIYRQEPQTSHAEPGQPSRVEQYLQKKTGASQTGVEKYLAKKSKQQKTTTQHQDNEENLTGVARYLAKKQQSTASTNAQESTDNNMTRVEKYLAQQQKKQSTAPHKTEVKTEPAPAKPEKKEAVTGVDKYLNRKKTTAPVVTPSKDLTPVTQEEDKQLIPAKTKTRKEEKKGKPEPKETKTTTAPKPAAEKASSGSSLIDLAKDADQCQAATLKGTRCRRKSNLETITKTINKQKYRFAVCSQHHNSDFVPFEELIQK